jgi:hypothetical protein
METVKSGAFVFVERTVNQERSANQFIVEQRELILIPRRTNDWAGSVWRRLTTSPGCEGRKRFDRQDGGGGKN